MFTIIRVTLLYRCGTKSFQMSLGHWVVVCRSLQISRDLGDFILIWLNEIKMWILLNDRHVFSPRKTKVVAFSFKFKHVRWSKPTRNATRKKLTRKLYHTQLIIIISILILFKRKSLLMYQKCNNNTFCLLS